MIWGVFGLLILFLLMGMPIFIVIGAVILLYLWGFSPIPLAIIPQQVIGAIDSFLLLAIPMFLLTGQILGVTDVSHRLLRFSQSLVGWMRGGLGQVNVMTSVFMAGGSGSSLGDAAAVGSAMIPIMKKNNYGAAFSAVLTICSACIVSVIPPSITMVLIGGLTSISIARMFLGGVVPGFMLALCFCIIIYLLAKKRNYPRGERFSVKEVASSFWSAVPSLGLPLIILGGILSGIFTPTEAAGIAAAYAILLGFIYKNLNWKLFYDSIVTVGITTGTIMIVVGISGILGWVLISANFGQYIVENMTGITENKTTMMFIILGILLLLGCFMEVMAVLVLVVPVLMPLVLHLGIDPVHFGVMATMALVTGLITPPFGLGMFLVCRMANVTIEDFSRELLPFLAGILLVMVILVLFPGLVVGLPDLFLGERI